MEPVAVTLIVLEKVVEGFFAGASEALVAGFLPAFRGDRGRKAVEYALGLAVQQYAQFESGSRVELARPLLRADGPPWSAPTRRSRASEQHPRR